MATALATLQGWRAHSMTSVRLRLTGLFGSVALLHLLGWGIFLLLIGILNLIILLDILRLFRRMKTGSYDRNALEHELVAGGLLTRIFGRLFKLITRSWQMYPIGFLFGLGFDTASEVSLLAISAGAAAQHLPLYAVISLPLIFAAGMSLMDTADGAFMSRAYSWAFSNPVRKVCFNRTVVE